MAAQGSQGTCDQWTTFGNRQFVGEAVSRRESRLVVAVAAIAQRRLGTRPRSTHLHRRRIVSPPETHGAGRSDTVIVLSHAPIGRVDHLPGQARASHVRAAAHGRLCTWLPCRKQLLSIGILTTTGQSRFPMAWKTCTDREFFTLFLKKQSNRDKKYKRTIPERSGGGRSRITLTQPTFTPRFRSPTKRVSQEEASRVMNRSQKAIFAALLHVHS